MNAHMNMNGSYLNKSIYKLKTKPLKPSKPSTSDILNCKVGKHQISKYLIFFI